MNLIARRDATQKTFDKYRHRPFDWNGATCIHLARTQLRNMGHKPPRIPAFRSALGAKRAMEAAGYASVADIFDGLGLPRIAPANMKIGDIAILPGEGGWDAVVISAGGKLLGWHGASDEGLQPIGEAVAHITGAWDCG